MKRHGIGAVLGLLTLFGGGGHALEPVSSSAAAPDLATPALLTVERGQLKYYLPGVNGGVVHSEQAAGEWNLCLFWAPWCQPCRDALLWLPGFASALRGQNVTLTLLAVDSDPESVRKFLETHGVDAPCGLVPSATASAWDGVKCLPTLYVVNPEGRVATVHEGWLFQGPLARELDTYTPPRAAAGRKARPAAMQP